MGVDEGDGVVALTGDVSVATRCCCGCCGCSVACGVVARDILGGSLSNARSWKTSFGISEKVRDAVVSLRPSCCADGSTAVTSVAEVVMLRLLLPATAAAAERVVIYYRGEPAHPYLPECAPGIGQVHLVGVASSCGPTGLAVGLPPTRSSQDAPGSSA